ncbi:MAG: hypothetical protein AAF385_09195 [Pseudomonadota bacterium]
MHKRLEDQLREAITDSATQQIDLPRLLSIIDAYYDKLDASTGQLETSAHALQAAFDNVADAVLTLNAGLLLLTLTKTAIRYNDRPQGGPLGPENRFCGPGRLAHSLSLL